MIVFIVMRLKIDAEHLRDFSVRFLVIKRIMARRMRKPTKLSVGTVSPKYLPICYLMEYHLK